MSRYRSDGVIAGGRKPVNYPLGPAVIDLSKYPDSYDFPAIDGFIDAFQVIPAHEDRMGIQGGRVAITEFRGPDQAGDPPLVAGGGGGRRGAVYRDFGPSMTNNVKIWTQGQPGDAILSGGNLGVMHFNPTGRSFGIGTWQWPANLDWENPSATWVLELGVIGYRQIHFAYLELITMPNGHIPVTDKISLRSVDGYAAIEVNDVIVSGPTPIPADILGSSLHGLQLDVGSDSQEGVGAGSQVFHYEIDATPFPAPPVPTFRSVGAAAESVGAADLVVPYPASIAAGDKLILIAGMRTGGNWTAPPGWDFASFQGAGNAKKITVFSKTATGSETGTITLTGTAGDKQGVMFSYDQVSTAANSPAIQGAEGISALPTAPGYKCFGPRREMMWVGMVNANTAITPPAGWTSRSIGVSGSSAMRLAVATRSQDSVIQPPFDAYAVTHTPPTTGSTAGSTTWGAAVVVLPPGN